MSESQLEEAGLLPASYMDLRLRGDSRLYVNFVRDLEKRVLALWSGAP